ncbi:conjugative transposon protein TraM [Flagellimonas meridianipacifica]|uniref:Uncharacterized protein DUF3714 n=1 Tax=Flagellimonas meridianipacifica TaxID=1080225 RepID=A0A2T0M8V5_9FLAO|nr:conjugative transposon protein TraM [Allomuricauda pacifica]PRX53967.1 uncharacterized protein DUF3714 [Allomuricauda pacifica]
MKIEKNKIVFGSVLAIVVIFIISYSMMVMGDDESETENLKQPLVPELEQEQEDYSSKLKAIDDLKEVRETNAPSIYDEKLIDTLGFYDPYLPEKNKQRIIDSIYAAGRINYTEGTYRTAKTVRNPNPLPMKKSKDTLSKNTEENEIKGLEIGLEHELFFASNPKVNDIQVHLDTDPEVFVTVDGTQVVKSNYRLRMRLTNDAVINGQLIPKNTPVFGFVTFQPNRTLISIENINHKPVTFNAYDLQDGSEGIYIENSFKADASREVLDDIVQDVNVAGLPQVGGIKQVFRRNNRNVKVTIVNNYQLILKPQRGLN